MKNVIQTMAGLLQAIENCKRSGNAEWLERHRARLDSLVKERMPSGSGFDNGTSIAPNSTPERIEFLTAFHHMHESGMYDGWTDHRVIVTPSLVHGFNMRITGRDRAGIKDYISDCFGVQLGADCPMADDKESR